MVERLDVWRDGDEVKQLDDTMNGVVLAMLREIFAQEEVVQVPSLKSRQRVDVNREVRGRRSRNRGGRGELSGILTGGGRI